MVDEQQCIAALTAAQAAVDDQSKVYVVPSRLRRALLLCQQYVAQRYSQTLPTFPLESLQFCVGDQHHTLVGAMNSLAVRLKRFRFMSEALQDIFSRQDEMMGEDVRTIIRELSAKA